MVKTYEDILCEVTDQDPHKVPFGKIGAAVLLAWCEDYVANTEPNSDNGKHARAWLDTLRKERLAEYYIGYCVVNPGTSLEVYAEVVGECSDDATEIELVKWWRTTKLTACDLRGYHLRCDNEDGHTWKCATCGVEGDNNVKK